ncbi:hypothetical protein Aph01nite_21420 [Acrocarpospora phusangensis]|uniref:Zinc finger CGNR domain-containing protein n=1 Tax=Acrocarpospora phusangensis TaxID=1070424 RepID=A0A919QCL3_9ACTN|nr:CGNR zinc finger domain-containing protein [Acrocarpospora phusangensis]GIH23832.1 hypothetical protein Aph01nite_21420 [Acrocarpospora phusangensis]
MKVQAADRAEAPGALGLVQMFVNSVNIEFGPDEFATADGLAAWLARHSLGTIAVGELDRHDAVALREAVRALLRENNGAGPDLEARRTMAHIARNCPLVVSFGTGHAIGPSGSDPEPTHEDSGSSAADAGPTGVARGLAGVTGGPIGVTGGEVRSAGGPAVLAGGPSGASDDRQGVGRLGFRPVLSDIRGALAVILASVAGAVADGSWQRLKACHEPRCEWIFYDRSRNRGSRWCSMAVCGTRAKMRVYREAKRTR